MHRNPTILYHLPTESRPISRMSTALSEALSFRDSVRTTSSLSLLPQGDQLSIQHEVELDTFSPNKSTLGTKPWRQSLGSGTSDLLRQGTRKIKLVKGSVLSIDYPVPSAIINSIQPEYRDQEDGFPEEFTTLRCMYNLLQLSLSTFELQVDFVQILLLRVTPMTSLCGTATTFALRCTIAIQNFSLPSRIIMRTKCLLPGHCMGLCSISETLST